MADPIYEVSDSPIYDIELRAIQNADPVNAEQLINPLLSKMINNTHAVKLSVDRMTRLFAVTVPAAWEGDSPAYTQTVAVPGILSTDTPVIDLVVSWENAQGLPDAAVQEKEWGYISKAVTHDDMITLYCIKKKPTVPLQIQIKAVR